MTFILALAGPLATASPAVAAPVASETEDDLEAAPPGPEAADAATPWWVWPVVLFVFSFLLGILTVPAGIGGGVLYVPLVSSFFPFHIDFVRSTGLVMALSGALAAAPGLLKQRLASLRLMIPCALFASMGSLAGAMVGLTLPARTVQIALGFCILLIAALMVLSKNVEFPRVAGPDRLARRLGLGGVFEDAHTDGAVRWTVHRTPVGMVLFIGVGFLAGMFGLGAGWANVPVLNLVLGVPVKAAVGSSVFMLSVTDTTAAWVYLRNGCWMPLIAIPSVFGLMLGTKVGVKVLGRTRSRTVRYLVIGVMLVAAGRSLVKGFWGV